VTGLVVLRFACACADVEPVVDALRTVVATPIHLREEMVRGVDFTDAETAERVAGALRRASVELVLAATEVDGLVDAVSHSRRRLPVRWTVLPVLRQGRLT